MLSNSAGISNAGHSDQRHVDPCAFRRKWARCSTAPWIRRNGRHVGARALSLGSVIWGQIAAMLGLPAAHFLAAAGALLTIPLTWRWKLRTAAGIDLTPSMHWPAPIITHEVAEDRGPVLVTVEYRIDPRGRAAFLAALDKLGQQRRRDGAAWGVFEDGECQST